MYCNHCNSKIPADAYYCSRCGRSVQDDKRCPECNSEINIYDSYCRICGASLSEKEHKSGSGKYDVISTPRGTYTTRNNGNRRIDDNGLSQRENLEKADKFAKYSMYAVGGQIANILLAYRDGYASRGLRISVWGLFICGTVFAILGLKSEDYKHLAIIALVIETIFGIAVLMPQ